MKTILITLALALLATPSYAAQGFCDGFRDGWRSAFRSSLSTPSIPSCPPPKGGNTYEAGYIEGVRAAALKGAR